MAYTDGTTAAFRYALIVIDYLFEHCEEVRAETLLEYGYPVENPNELVKIFTGNIRGNVNKKIGLSASAAGDAQIVLSAMRCTTRIRGGGHRMSSIYLLHYKPTIEQYIQFRERQGNLTQRIAPSKWDQTLTDIADLRIRVTKLEEALVKAIDQLNGHSHSGHNV